MNDAIGLPAMSAHATDAQATVRRLIEQVRAEGRDSLTAPEGKQVYDACGIVAPREGFATSADEATKLAPARGFPAVLKIVSPPLMSAKLMVEMVNDMEAEGISKPIVPLPGDAGVEEAAEYLYADGIPAYAYSTELPVQVLGARYKRAHGAGLLQ